MTQKLAVLVIHGLGRQKNNFADPFIRLLLKHYAKASGERVPDKHLAIKPVYWAEVLEEREEELKRRQFQPSAMRYEWLRHYVIHYLGDAVAYQPLETNNQIYLDIHEKLSKALHELTTEAGENAPLCVISHSMGTVIASNYFYDLQNSVNWKPVLYNPDSALERGETLSLFYSCGTTLPLWSLRYRNFDKPIHVPADQMRIIALGIRGEWINFYDKDDILGYPLRSIHEAYEEAVQEDIKVRVGDWKTSWNPLCHNGYFASSKVVSRMASGLATTWRELNL
ncbi:MAG: chemotaxis protein [Candidatus Pristimantibacillus sp.]